VASEIVGFDDDSARRIARAVRADESMRPGSEQAASRDVGRRQVYTFVRYSPDTLDSVTAETFDAVEVSTELGFDFESLVVTCNTDAPAISEDAARQEINQAAFMEGCVFHGDLFEAVPIAGKWYAIGCGHTAVIGTYDWTDNTVVIPDCNRRKVPVQPLTSDIILVDGTDYLAEWVRAQRVYVVTVAGCEEE
jgi:hypothetical protein